MSTSVAQATVRPKGRILIVDDDQVVRDSLNKWFASEGYQARPAAGGREALELLHQGEHDVALIDIRMPGMDGMELQARLREADPALTVIIMTAYATVETAIQALKRGAYDYITKPVDPDELSHLVAKAFEHRRASREVAQLRENLQEAFPSTELIGKTAAIKSVLEQIEMLAPTDSPVLITGESGTGKEVVARSIHAASPRRYMPLAAIHCGALSETLLEGELFGYERGAFSGAQYRKKGKFEVADGGTIFLDEVSDISLRIQTELLRVLQGNEIVRAGASERTPVDVRWIVATQKDLAGLADAGAFRPDLYHLLSASRIALPPLRDRLEDIPLLVSHFLNKFCMATSRPVPRVSAGAMDLLMRHEWPGNVRELENAVERALVIGRGTELRPENFTFQFHHEAVPAGRTIGDVERAHIERILRETDGNMSRAARILDIDRTTLYNKLRRYGTR
jgi:two-component system, NtrC family, response regulator HydG